MSRLESRFQDLRRAGRTALVPYITAGDPGPDATVPLMHVLVEAGADVLELGVPFSDPAADGPDIQSACERALQAGTALRDVLKMVSEFRRRNEDTPVVLMGYLNPLEAMGIDAFSEEAARVGVDGVLTVDMPPEEAGGLAERLRFRGIDPIFLLAPTTSPDRARRICEMASGFVYYVSLKGVTGAASMDTQSVTARVEELKRFTKLPLGVGFGVRDAVTAAELSRVADAVIVGSAIVRRIAEHGQDAVAMRMAVRDFVRELRQAMDARTVVA